MRRPRPRRGVALIMVLFVIAVLMIAVLDFAHSMQVYAMIGGNTRHDVHLRGALHAGVAVAEHLLLEDLRSDVDQDSLMDHLEENWAGDVGEITVEGAVAEVTIADAAGKFPLSSLVQYTIEDGVIVESQVDAERREQLVALFDELKIDSELVDVLVDWLDVNDEPEPAGAEAAEYAAVGRACRNGPLTSIDELELLLGYTREIVWGDPDHDLPGLADVCTIYARPDLLVNANTAPEPVLYALLQADDLARRVAGERERDPFVDAADLNERVGDSSVSRFLGTASGVWDVTIAAHTDHVDRPLAGTAHAVLVRTIEPPEDAEEDADVAAQADEAEAPIQDAIVNPGDRGIVRVVSWKEIR